MSIAETPPVRLKRLRMRSWRRGIKEMDLILGSFADARLDHLAPDEIDNYDALLSENDHDLYRWVSGQEAPPAPYADLVARVVDFTSHSRGVASP